MNKFASYIVNGQGIGARFMFLLAFILALQTGWLIRESGMRFIPQAQMISDQFLPLKIENGEVVEPQNAVKNIYIPLVGSEGMRLQLDTTRDTFDAAELKTGIYLSRTALYTVNGNDVKISRFDQNVELPKKDYRDFFLRVINWTGFFMVISATGVLFLFYLFMTLLYNTLLIPIARLAGRRYDFDQRMRLSAIAVTAAFLLRWLLGAVVYMLSFPAALLLVIVFQGLLLLQLAKTEKA